VGKAKRAHRLIDAWLMVGTAQVRLCPAYDDDDETALNRAKNRFSALAAVHGVR
jgi:predicted xylose isomerase-like sugar epimerase